MELETPRLFTRAAQSSGDAELRQLLGDLAEAERRREDQSRQFDPARCRDSNRTKPRSPGSCSCSR